MTVLSTVSSVSYATDGTSRGPYTVPFYFLEDADLIVQSTVSGVTSTLALNADYTVTGAGDPLGGAVTTVLPVANGSIAISRDPPVTQTASYPSHGRFPAESHERALDRRAMIEQRLKKRIDDLYSTYNIAQLSQILNSGVPLAEVMTRPGEPEIVAPLVTRARSWRLITDRNTITGNGTSDDWTAVQAEINAAIANSQELIIPPKCNIRVTAPLLANGRLKLRGPRPAVVSMTAYPNFHTRQSLIDDSGFFFFDHTGAGIVLNPVASTDAFLANNALGSYIKGLGFRRNQPSTLGSSFTPLVTGFDLDIQNTARIELDNLVAPNSSNFISLTRNAYARMTRITGQPLRVGVLIDGAFDVSTMDDIQFNWYWSSDTPVVAWMAANAEAFQIGHVDTILGGRIFNLGYKIGAHFFQNNTDLNAFGVAGAAQNLCDFEYFFADATTNAVWFNGDINNPYGSEVHFGYLGAFQSAQTAAQSPVTIFGSNIKLDIDHFVPGPSSGGSVFIDTAGARNRVHIGRMKENAFGQFAAFNLQNGSATSEIEVEKYDKYIVPTQTSPGVFSYAPYAPTNARASGNVRVVLTRGVQTTNVDGTGSVTVTHNIGNDHPNVVKVDIQSGAVQWSRAADPSTTQFKITFYDRLGAPLATGTSVTFVWEAGYGRADIGY